MGLFENRWAKYGYQLESLFLKFGLIHHVISFVKHEDNNLITMAYALGSIIDCEPLKLIKVCENTCFGHVMYKACNYVTNDDKISKGLMQVSVKDAQATLQMTIAWTEKIEEQKTRMGKGLLKLG
jgi:hypothetical protein